MGTGGVGRRQGGGGRGAGALITFEDRIAKLHYLHAWDNTSETNVKIMTHANAMMKKEILTPHPLPPTPE